jgi:type III secretory pathway component EscT
LVAIQLFLMVVAVVAVVMVVAITGLRLLNKVADQTNR